MDCSGLEPVEFGYERQDGSGKSKYRRPWLGIYADMQRRYNEAYSAAQRESYEKYMAVMTCEHCGGKRLKPEALAVTVGGKNIYELSSLSVGDSITFFEKLKLTATEKTIAHQILKEITSRLQFMKNVGLDDITL